MNLAQYIHSFPNSDRRKTRQQLAKEIGISENYMYHMCSGSRRIPEKHAVKIERATNGAVTRQEICPELYE